MGRVLTNNFSLAYAIQSAFNVFTTAAGDWKLIEPNEVTNFGPTITTVARTPISKIRGARKGTVTDLDAAAEIDADLTLDSFIDFVEGFAFAIAVNSDMVFPPRLGNRAALEGDATATGYTIPSATAPQAAKFQFTAAGPISLVFARGYIITGNNGLKALTADVVATDTEIAVAGNAVEAAPANATVEMAGMRAEAGDLAITVAAGIGTLTSGNGAPITAIDFTTLGWTVGQTIHVGGLTNANRFFGAGPIVSFGFARITSIVAASVGLDKVDVTLITSDGTDTGAGGTEVATDLLYGRFIRNVAVDSTEFTERIFLIEGAFPNLFETDPPTPVPDPDGFEYVLNSFCNQMAWTLPLTDKSTVNFSFVGTDAEAPVDNASRRVGADTAAEPLETTALNTSSDIGRLRILDDGVDLAGLTTDFKNLVVTINNNVTPEKVLGKLGARFINVGNLAVTIEGNILFTSPLVIARIRNNATVTFDFIVSTDDGAIVVDLPAMTLGGGARELPVNESIQLALTGEAFIDPILGTVFGMSLFAVVP